MDNDLTKELCEQVSEAHDKASPLKISAGNSKAFYGRKVEATELSLKDHSGIIDYHASELVITARSGTKLSDIESALAENNQMFAFEPPCHNEISTLGGIIACGLSGPRRGFTCAARDAVLGTNIINGKGEFLKFGGQVMKNVAGYDASRLMVGAQGTLGVLLDISVKVLPKPESETTLSFEMSFADTQQNIRQWILQGHPISASSYHDNQLMIRLSSTENSVTQARQTLGGEQGDLEVWNQLRDQTHEFFSTHKNIWRISVPPATPMFAEDKAQLIEWNGALRWIACEDETDDSPFAKAKVLGGHATRYTLYSEQADEVFQPLAKPMLLIQQKLKASFDPKNILNPGRLYPEL